MNICYDFKIILDIFMEDIMVKNNEIDMINGKTLKKMIFFSIPIIFTSIFQLLFNTIDIIVVGRYAGSTALAGVGATSSLINLLVSLLIGISMGISVTMGKYCGARDYKNASDTVHNAIGLAIYTASTSTSATISSTSS